MTQSPCRPSLVGVFLFTAAYLLGATAVALWQANSEFMFYVIVMFFLSITIVSIHMRVEFSIGVLWALSIWGLMHVAGGLLPVPDDWPTSGDFRVLYSLWLIPGILKYDNVVHTYGFGVTACACWQAMRTVIAKWYAENSSVGTAPRRIEPTIGMLVLCAAAAMGLGTLNEVVEFIAVLTMPQTNVGGYVNTGFDLVANMVGATVACSAIGLASKYNKQKIST